jgi:hypothetical protein
MDACRSVAPLEFIFQGVAICASKSSIHSSLRRFLANNEIGCERGYAASAANSLAQLAFFNGL